VGDGNYYCYLCCSWGVIHIRIMKLPHFPAISGAKRSRVITKHFTNCSMFVPRNEFAMLTWLIYQSEVDNSFTYNTHLLRKFSASVKYANEEYGGKKVNTSLYSIRSCFKALTKNGLLLPTSDEKVFIVSPMLSYRPEYVRPKEYGEFVGEYHGLSVSGVVDFTARYMNFINVKLKKKKL